MKKIHKIVAFTFLVGLMGACTSEFDEINVNPAKVSESDVESAKNFFTQPQYKLYAPDRYPYWRAQLIHGDRYAGYFTFGFNGSWWSDELGYSFNGGYTDAAFDWLSNSYGNIINFLELTETGASMENERMYAMGLILKGLYFQMYTDIFGEVPYTEAGNVDVIPVLDTQDVIYKGVIDELDEAMTLIGNETATGVGVHDIAENDLFYGGDLQMWKKLANSLKLRMALRAYGATGADFSTTAISEALSAPLLDTGEDALLHKDNKISQWNAAAYGDVWHNFGGNGSKWRVGQPLVDFLRDNNDPRLASYTEPAEGGKSVVRAPDDATEQKRYDFIIDHLTNSGVTFTETDSTYTADDGTESNFKIIEMAESTYYVGQPNRLNGFTYDFAHGNFFSQPTARIIEKKNNNAEIFNELVFTAAESYFLQAEAVQRNLVAGDANALYRSGIEASMKLWGVSDLEINNYLTNEAEANLIAGRELEQIATQKWIALYTDGFEGWANVRKSGFPADLADGVSDTDIFGPGDINGAYPQRMRYGSTIRNTNGTNLDAAIARQGADRQDTKLWWAK